MVEGTTSTGFDGRDGRAARRLRLAPVLPSATLLLVATIVLATVPFWLRPVHVSMVMSLLILGLFALSLDLMLTTGGMPSLGHAVYFGAGAYAAGLVAIHYNTNILVMLASAAGAAAACGVLTGWLIARTRGAYLLILTVAVGELVAAGANQWRSLTGGSDGLLGIPAASVWPGHPLSLIDPTNTYWVVLVAAAAGAVALELVRRSPFSRILRGIRDNELRMRALGYRPMLYKYAAITLAASVAGVAGALSVVQLQFTSPSDLRFVLSSLALIAIVIGGGGRWWGPAVGAAVVVLSKDLLPADWQGYAYMILGGLFIVIVYLLPGGVGGAVDRQLARRRRPRPL